MSKYNKEMSCEMMNIFAGDLQDGDLEKLETLLKNGADPNYISDEWTPITAAMCFSSKTVSILLQYGADPNKFPINNYTPLTMAAFLGKLDVFIMLLNAGANIFLLDDCKLTPLHAVSFEVGDLPLSEQDLENAKFEEIAKLSLQLGVNPNQKDVEGKTALDYAFKYRPNIMKIFELYNKPK